MESPQDTHSTAPNNQPAPQDVVPRYHLPDDWSGKGACPVCRTPGRLSVQHQDVAPDRMLCGACGTAFEVEGAGARIRLAAAPPALAARTAGLLNAWLAPAELLLVLERPTPDSAGSPFEPLAAALSTSPASPASLPAVPLAATVNPAGTLARPPAPKMANGAQTASEAEPGTEDWFASLAAVIGGTLPASQLSDAVLADELERALLGRSDDDVSRSPAAVVRGDVAPSAARAPVVATGSATRVESAPAPSVSAGVTNYKLPLTPPAAPEPKTADQVLAEAIATLSAPLAPPPATPAPLPVESAPAVTPAYRAPRDGSLGSADSQPTAAPAAITDYQMPLAAAAALVPSTASVPVVPAPPAISGPPPSRRELSERAWKLHEMGNSLNAIRSTLESSGATLEDNRAIMEKLIALEQARHERFQRTLQWALLGGLTVVFVLLAIAIVISSLASPSAPAANATPRLTALASAALTTPGAGTPVPAGTQLAPTPTLAYSPIIAIINGLLPGDVKLANGPTPGPAPTSATQTGQFAVTPTLSSPDLATRVANSTGLPAWVATLVPNAITAINVPTPSVDPKGPAGAPCPATSAQASALFGGPAGSWSFNHQEQGWILILAGAPTSIRVPAGMSAGYLVIGKTLEMRTTQGPATVNNVNFIAVSCQ